MTDIAAMMSMTYQNVWLTLKKKGDLVIVVEAEKSFIDISEELNIPLNETRSIYKSAIAKLKVLLSSRGIDAEDIFFDNYDGAELVY